MGRLISLVKVSTKLGLSGGAVYGTQQLGFWGNSKQGEQVLYYLFCTYYLSLFPNLIMKILEYFGFCYWYDWKGLPIISLCSTIMGLSVLC